MDPASLSQPGLERTDTNLAAAPPVGEFLFNDFQRPPKEQAVIKLAFDVKGLELGKKSVRWGLVLFFCAHSVSTLKQYLKPCFRQ